MHYRFIVAMNKDNADNSEEARKFVRDYLVDNGFCSPSNRWSAGQADWFVIGGRWSGELVKKQMDIKKLEVFEEDFKKKHGWWLGGLTHMTEEIRKAQSILLFKEHFPKYISKYKEAHLYWRDQYAERGYEDDAQICNQKLFDNLIKELYSASFIYDSEQFCDIEDTRKCESKDFVGNTWIVVVDYHN